MVRDTKTYGHVEIERDRPENMFEKAGCRCATTLACAIYHAREHSANGKESLRSSTDVTQAQLICQDLLYYKCCNSPRKLSAHLHCAKAQRNNFRGKKKIDHRLHMYTGRSMKAVRQLWKMK